MKIRMHCIEFGCTQSTESCAARHVAARRIEERGFASFRASGMTTTYGCATCATGAHLANLPLHTEEPRSMHRPWESDHRRKRRGKVYVYKGEARTLREWGAEFAIPVPTLDKRLRHGMTIAEAIETPRRKVKMITYRGQTRSIRAWALETGLNWNTIIDRLRRGWTVEETLNTPPRGERGAA